MKASNTHRGLLIRKEPDGRWDVYETKDDFLDRRPVADNFQVWSMAVSWIDSVWFEGK